jgi:hypothetical protein
MTRLTIVVFLLTLAIVLRTVEVDAGPLDDPEQALQGLLSGDKVHDRGLVAAFQRGYQRGLEDAKAECQAEVAKALAQCKK